MTFEDAPGHADTSTQWEDQGPRRDWAVGILGNDYTGKQRDRGEKHLKKIQGTLCGLGVDPALTEEEVILAAATLSQKGSELMWRAVSLIALLISAGSLVVALTVSLGPMGVRLAVVIPVLIGGLIAYLLRNQWPAEENVAAATAIIEARRAKGTLARRPE